MFPRHPAIGFGAKRVARRASPSIRLCAALLALGLQGCTKRADPSPTNEASWLFLDEPVRKAMHALVAKPWHQSPGWYAYSYLSSSLYFSIPWSKVLELRSGMTSAEVEAVVGPLMFGITDNAVVFSTYPEDDWEYEVALKFSKNRSVLEDISYLPAPGAAARAKLQTLGSR